MLFHPAGCFAHLLTKGTDLLKDVLDWFFRAEIRPLLTVFLGITLTTFIPGPGPLNDPFSLISATIPLLIATAHLLVGFWIQFVRGLNYRLTDLDRGDWSMLIGGSGLAFCLCVAAWYVSNTPDPLSFNILADVDFIRLFTLYLLSMETIKVPRYVKTG